MCLTLALMLLPEGIQRCLGAPPALLHVPHVHGGLPQRLMRDFKRLQQDPPQGVNASPNTENIMLWNAVIFGPEDTPWDGGACLLLNQAQPRLPCMRRRLDTSKLT